MSDVVATSDLPGFSGIYSFPFRFYSTDKLEKLRSETKDGRIFEVYPPFPTRELGAPLIASPAMETWPDFEWSPDFPPSERCDIVTVRAKPKKSVYVGDTLRVSLWSGDPDREINHWVDQFLLWLRHYTGQAWISDIELLVDISHSYQFEVDSHGRALASPITSARIQTWPSWCKPITHELWSNAFLRVVRGDEPLLYWHVFFDAHQHRARSRIREATLFLAFSMEICRDTLFPTIQFDGTDLLRHLDVDLRSATGSGLADHSPELFTRIKQLYIGRHKIAHGKKPEYPSDSGMVPITLEVIRSWEIDVIAVLNWLESKV